MPLTIVKWHSTGTGSHPEIKPAPKKPKLAPPHVGQVVLAVEGMAQRVYNDLGLVGVKLVQIGDKNKASTPLMRLMPKR